MAGKALRILRNTLIGSSVGIGGLYIWDRSFNRSAIARTTYAFYGAARIGIDYKLHFREGEDIEALHERNAHRLYDIITRNKGLYIKVGQSIAIQGNMLPEPYRKLLGKLFDDAPQDPWEDSLEMLRSSLGVEPSEIFEYIDEKAVASASIAQVHRAKLRSNGEEVAVKIQHADIPTSAKWDLYTYTSQMWFYSKFVFKMPMYFMAKYVADQVLEETDFTVELRNSQVMKKLVDEDPETRDRLYIPRVYPEYSSNRVLVMEWIDGSSLSRPDDVRRAGYDVKGALTTVFKTLTKEAFEWGVVHSDPHPGNWILRKDPLHPKRDQLVMLDHGLYVYMDDKLRMEYARLWRAMFKRDLPEITRITSEWGFGDPKFFASATMLQPYDESVERPDQFREEEHRANRMREFLKDTSRIPLVLVFVGRTQRILQGLNQIYGSPVNRMHILVDEALKVPASETELRGTWRHPWMYRTLDWVYRRLLLLVTDTIFVFLRIKQSFTKQDPETAFDESLQQDGMALLNK